MRHVGIGLCLLAVQIPACASAQPVAPAPPAAQVGSSAAERAVVDISRTKWGWMAERNLDTLDALFDEKAVFVHMSRTLSKADELDVIKTGNIQYKHAEIQEVSVRTVGSTVIVLSKIILTAIVRGNDAVNPFMVTEVYVKKDGAWKLGALCFTRLVSA